MSDSANMTIEVAPISTLLVPTDFSKGAEQALGRALSLPLAHAAKLHLLFVFDEPTFDAPLRRAQAAAAAAMKEALSRAREMATKRGVTIAISGQVVAGRPFEQIVRLSRLLGAELIVLGRHGRRPLRDMFIGTTADRVVRYGDLPVLVVGRRARHPYRRPMAAVDFGETTRETLATLLHVVGPEVEEIALVHSYPAPPEGLVTTSSTRNDAASFRRSERARVSAVAAAMLAELQPRGISWRTLLVQGDPRGTVLRTAWSRRADLIALGTHARRGLSRLPIGSVAEWVVAQAQCDVLITRPARFTFEPLP